MIHMFADVIIAVTAAIAVVFSLGFLLGAWWAGRK